VEEFGAASVDRAALGRHLAPEGGQCLLQPSAAVAKRSADSLQEAGERLFTFTRLPISQWKSARTTNAIERLHEEFKRRIKTQTVLPSAETAAMLFWALLAAGQITMRKVDGWQTLTRKLANEAVDLAA
jgi:transposase-like protein